MKTQKHEDRPKKNLVVYLYDVKFYYTLQNLNRNISIDYVIYKRSNNSNNYNNSY